MWHVPVIAIVAESGRRLATDFTQPGLMMAAIEGALAILVARASYRYIEWPLLDR